MAERKITVRNVSIALHVAHTTMLGDTEGKQSADIASVDANSIAHAIMLTLAKEGYKIPDMKCEVVK